MVCSAEIPENRLRAPLWAHILYDNSVMEYLKEFFQPTPFEFFVKLHNVANVGIKGLHEESKKEMSKKVNSRENRTWDLLCSCFSSLSLLGINCKTETFK